MAWGVEFTGYISRVTKSSLQDLKEEYETYLANDKIELAILAAFTPDQKASKSDNQLDVLDDIRIRVNDLFENIVENAQRLILINQALEDEDAKDV